MGDRGRPPKKFATFYDFSRFFLRNIFGIFAKIKSPKFEEKTDFGVGEVSASKACGGAHGSLTPPPTFKNVPTPTAGSMKHSQVNYREQSSNLAQK